MSVILGVGVGLVLLSLMMFVHEWGHYWVGKRLGFKILEFSIFMGPRLLSWERKGIRYSLKLIPIGASVRFSGEFNGSPEEWEAARQAGTLFQPGDFYERPPRYRAAVVAAGPLVNLACGVLAFFLLFATLGYSLPVLAEVTPHTQLAEAGLQTGDRILSYAGQAVRNELDLKAAFLLAPQGETMPLTYERAGHRYTAQLSQKPVEQPSLGINLELTPQGMKVAGLTADRPETDPLSRLEPGDLLLKFADQEASTEAAQAFWTQHPGQALPITLQRAGQRLEVAVKPIQQLRALPLGLTLEHTHQIWGAVPQAFGQSWSLIKMTFRSIGHMITGRLSAKQNLSGPVGLVSSISSVVNSSELAWSARLILLMNLFALISLSLGIMNLLPIAPLDGSQLLMCALEGIRGKPLGYRAQQIWTTLGLGLVLLLFLLGFYFDLSRLMG